MKKINTLLLSLLFYTLTGFGISLTIIAGIGVSSLNAMNLSLAELFSLKIGTITALVNSLFLILYIILTKGKLLKTYLIQALSVFSLGFVINFFTYQLLGSITLTDYPTRLLLFIIASLIGGFGTGMVLNLKVLAFPIESVCQIISSQRAIPFSKVRYGVDIFSVGTSLVISLITQSDIYVREGTIISLILLSMTISITKSLYEKYSVPKLSQTKKRKSHV